MSNFILYLKSILKTLLVKLLFPKKLSDAPAEKAIDEIDINQNCDN